MDPHLAASEDLSKDSYAARENDLSRIDSLLELEPNSLDLLLAKAHFLTELGRVEEAKLAYLKAVTLAPQHFGALNNFGKFLYENGYLSAARTVLRQAIEHHPGNPIGYTNLANVFFKNHELESAREYYQKAPGARF